MTDRDLWLMVRRALLMIVKAIESRYLEKQTVHIGDNNSESVAGAIHKNSV